ncbi:unnamed protein product, partial [Mesorhabditis belari]|uniref:Uncharacterized protein n=1 Tax=Mesorhabditis belari TaxID=2138241 RepID=A0AAF3J9W9_9BILA
MILLFLSLLHQPITTHPTQIATISSAFHRVIGNVTVLGIPEGPTSWEDEAQMRDRMALYAKEKFAKGSHHWSIDDHKEIQRKREKRDGGSLSVPIATAIVTGMIGMTTKTVQDLVNAQYSVSSGGCAWFGTAPMCNYPCPSDYDYIRAHTGRCSNWWLSGFCVPDESFGKPCSTVLGDYFRKRFCCKSDPMECTWSGRWMGANTAHNIYCRYDNAIGQCGALDCAINHEQFKAQNASDIVGERCDRLNLFGLRGKATCGYIAWFDESGQIVNSWYKTK